MSRETFRGQGGISLFYRPSPVSNSRASLALVHGLAEHSGRYTPFIDFFNRAGFSVYAFDLRGHGRSEGARAHADRWEDFLDDIQLFLKKVSREANSPLFLAGHSLGGQLVLNYAASSRRDEITLKGFVVSSPNIRLAVKIPFYKVYASQALSRWAPKLLLANEVSPEFLSHNPAVVRAYKEDPLVTRKITTRLGDLILGNQEIIFSLARKIRLPGLLLHAGADKICHPSATKEFYEKIPVEDKRLKIYEGFYHELFNEVGRETVFRDIQRWLEDHL